MTELVFQEDLQVFAGVPGGGPDHRGARSARFPSARAGPPADRSGPVTGGHPHAQPVGRRHRLDRLAAVLGDGRPRHRGWRVRSRCRARRDRDPGGGPGAALRPVRSRAARTVRVRADLLRAARLVHGGPEPLRGAPAHGHGARTGASRRRRPGHARAGYGSARGRRVRGGVRRALPRGARPQPLFGSDVHPALADHAPEE